MYSPPTPTPPEPAPSAPRVLPPAAPPIPRWPSTQLLAQGSLAEITHGDQVYRLRLTALGKLILTK